MADSGTMEVMSHYPPPPPPRPGILAPIILFTIYLIHHYLTKERVILPPSFPIINSRPSDRYFRTLRAKFRNTVNFESTMALANTPPYNTEPAILPLLGIPNLILLPRSDIDFVQSQPRSILDPAQQTDQRLQLDYTSPNPDLMNLHEHVAQNRAILDHFTTQIGNLIPDVVEETDFAATRAWGRNQATSGEDEWTTICVYRSVTEILALVSDRIFVGSPLNRTQKIIDVGTRYAVDLPLISALIRCFWDPIVPLVGWLLTVPVRRRARQFEKLLEPEIQKRIKAWDLRHGKERGDSDSDTEKKVSSYEPEPNDAIQWCLNTAKATGDPFMWKLSTIADRILIMNFASIHTSDYALTQVLLDLAYSKQEYVEELGEEVETSLKENGGWTEKAIGRLVKLDSTLRESSRLNSFQPAALPRVVLAEEGIKTPSSGDFPRAVLW